MLFHDYDSSDKLHSEIGITPEKILTIQTKIYAFCTNVDALGSQKLQDQYTAGLGLPEVEGTDPTVVAPVSKIICVIVIFSYYLSHCCSIAWDRL